MRRLIAACVLVLAGCTQMSGDFDFHGPPEDYPAAYHAAAEWNACGVVEVRARVGAGDVPIWKVQTLPGVDIGLTSFDPLRIKYTTGYWSTQAVLTHEMGHALGLEHTAHGVMAPRLEGAHVGPDECRALRDAYR